MIKPRIVKRSLKIVLISVALIAAGLGLAIMAAEPVLNSDRVKSRIENIIGEALDMSFKIDGRIKLGFLPFLSVVANNVNVSTPQGKIASVDRIEVDPRWLDLMFLKVHLDDVQIHNPQLTFDPHALDKISALVDGDYAESSPVESLVIDSFSISRAMFFYSDSKSAIDLIEMNFEGGPITIIEGRKIMIDDVVSLFQAINFRGEVAARGIFSQDFKLTNIKAKVKNEKNKLTFDPIEAEYLGSAASLRATLDFTKEKQFLESQISISDLNIGTLAKKFNLDHQITGNVNITANTSAGPVDIDQIHESTLKNSRQNESNSNNRLQAISQGDGPVAEEFFPVGKVEIKSIMVSASNVKFAKNNIKIDNAQMEITGGRLTVVEKNKLIIRDLETLWRNARFDAKIRIRKLSVGDENFDNIKTVIHGDRGILQSDLIEVDYLGAQTKIVGILAMEDSLNHLKVRIEMPVVDLKKSIGESGEAEFVTGVININAEFEARMAYIKEILGNMNGNFSIKGRNLILKGVDLDKALDEFKKIRGYGFNDFSALILLGPLGAVVSHGYDQLEALEKIMAATGDSTIKHVVSDWNVAAGVVTASDVAFSTKRNRVAVKGSLDLANKKFNSLIVAVVDSQGCIVNSETVSGTFEKPEIKDVGAIDRTVIRPLKRFLKTKCDFFYSGSVPHPTRKQ